MKLRAVVLLLLMSISAQASVDDSGLESLRKAAVKDSPGEYHFKVGGQGANENLKCNLYDGAGNPITSVAGALSTTGGGGGGGGSNASVSATGALVPAYATFTAGQDGAGNLHGLDVTDDGLLARQPDETKLKSTVYQGGAWSFGLPTNACQETGGNLASIAASSSSIDGKLTTTNSSLSTVATNTGNTATSAASIDTKFDVLLSTRASEATLSSFKSANHADLLGINTTLGSPFQAGGSIGNTSFIANAGTNLNTSLLALESGGHLASMDTKLSTINTTLGSPFQAGGSIGNTSFGATQATAANLNATVVGPSGVALAKDSSLATINTTLGSPFQAGGSIGNTSFIANAGTNLNTSALALDTTVSGLQVSQASTTSGQKGVLSLGAVTTAAPTYTTAQTNPLSLTTAGALRTDSSGSTQPISGSVSVSNFPATQPVSGTVTALQGTSPWVTSRNWTLSSGTDSVASAQSGTWTTGRTWNLSSGSDSVAATQSGTWTIQPGNTANTTPWLFTINQGGNSATVTGSNALKVDGSAVTQPVSGSLGRTWTLASGTDSVASVQSGAWSTGRTWTLASGTDSIAAVQSTASNLNAQVVGNVASGATDSGNPVKTGAIFNTTQPTVTNAQRVDSQATARGGLIVATGADIFHATVDASALPSGAATEATLATRASAANQTSQITQETTTATNTGSISTNLGVQADTVASTDTGTFSLIALTKRLNQHSTTIEGYVDGIEGLLGTSNTNTGTTATNTGTTATNTGTISTRIGDLTETAPASDTASSGLNGRLQRIAQRLTSLIAFFSSDFGASSGGIRVAAQTGNATGAYVSGAGTTGAQVQRVVLPTDQTGINTFLDKAGTGTITALNGAVVLTTNGASNVTFTLTGTWSASVVPQGSSDGTNWNNAICSLSYGTVSGSFVANASFICPVGGWQQYRLVATSFTSGTVNVQYNISSGSQLQTVTQFEPTALNGTMRIKDGSGNALTSTFINGTVVDKQAHDVVMVHTGTTRYFTTFTTQQTAATAANATVFTMRNAAASTKMVIVESVACRMGFNAANPITRTQQSYLFQRFSAATPTGGTALTAGLGDSADAASQVTDIRFLDTGLTTTGVTFVANNLSTMACDTTQGIACDRSLITPPMAWAFASGEGLAIRLGVAAVAGQSVSCNIGWREQ